MEVLIKSTGCAAGCVCGLCMSRRYLKTNKRDNIKFFVVNARSLLQEKILTKKKTGRKALKEIKGRQAKVRGIKKAKVTAGKQKK